MLQAAVFDVRDFCFRQRSQIVLVTGQWVNQERLFRPQHSRPWGDRHRSRRPVTPRHRNFFHWPLRPVRGGGPPVGAFDMAVHGGGDALLEHFAIFEQHTVQD